MVGTHAKTHGLDESAAGGGGGITLVEVYDNGAPADNAVPITPASGPIVITDGPGLIAADILLGVGPTAGAEFQITAGGAVLVAPASGQSALVTLAGAGGFSVDITGTGVIEFQDGGANVLAISSAGAVAFTPTAGADVTMTLAGASNFLTDITGTGTYQIRDGGSNVFVIDSAGNITITPTSGASYSNTVAGAGNILLSTSGTGVIQLRDGATPVLSVSGVGAVAITPTAGQSFTSTVSGAGHHEFIHGASGYFSVIGGGQDTIFVSSAGRVKLKSAAGQDIEVSGDSTADLVINSLRVISLADDRTALLPIGEPWQNTSGAAVTAGQVVIIDTANADSCKTTTTANSPLVLGVVVVGAADFAPCVVAVGGKCNVIVDASAVNIARGDMLATSTVAGRAIKATPAFGAVFAKAIDPATTDNATIACEIWRA